MHVVDACVYLAVVESHQSACLRVSAYSAEKRKPVDYGVRACHAKQSCIRLAFDQNIYSADRMSAAVDFSLKRVCKTADRSYIYARHINIV